MSPQIQREVSYHTGSPRTTENYLMGLDVGLMSHGPVLQSWPYIGLPAVTGGDETDVKIPGLQKVL